MRAIMLMFDTLTRKYLPNYGCQWTQLPNFARLEKNCTRFDNFYAGSLPCMPARRELHTGKYNFLHRSWGPLEPFDHSGFEILQRSGIYTHLVTDHSHYWEDGGATYHNRYSSWEGFRGQEGDRFAARDTEIAFPTEYHPLNKKGISVEQHYHNRRRQQNEENMPSVKTVQAGLDFLKEHAQMENWFLQIECFDPHEPFYVPDSYRRLYGLPKEETLFWPRYGEIDSSQYKGDIELSKKEYAALLTMCDAQLGKVLDFMDDHHMWEDTLLMVNTDHGFLLGEHGYFGKNFPPLHDELVHLPFFIHVPGQKEGSATKQLGATVDVMPTLLDYFGCDLDQMGEMDGCSLRAVLENDQPIHEMLLFGVHGSYTCCADGKFVYMKANSVSGNQPIYEYTWMPTNMRGFFNRTQLEQAEIVTGSRFTNGIPCVRIPANLPYFHADHYGDRLYDVQNDPEENENLLNCDNQKQWNRKLQKTMEKTGAPEEEYRRLGLMN